MHSWILYIILKKNNILIIDDNLLSKEYIKNNKYNIISIIINKSLLLIKYYDHNIN